VEKASPKKVILVIGDIQHSTSSSGCAVSVFLLRKKRLLGNEGLEEVREKQKMNLYVQSLLKLGKEGTVSTI
jgi:hypothetical protein